MTITDPPNYVSDLKFCQKVTYKDGKSQNTGCLSVWCLNDSHEFGDCGPRPSIGNWVKSESFNTVSTSLCLFTYYQESKARTFGCITYLPTAHPTTFCHLKFLHIPALVFFFASKFTFNVDAHYCCLFRKRSIFNFLNLLWLLQDFDPTLDMYSSFYSFTFLQFLRQFSVFSAVFPYYHSHLQTLSLLS